VRRRRDLVPEGFVALSVAAALGRHFRYHGGVNPPLPRRKQNGGVNLPLPGIPSPAAFFGAGQRVAGFVETFRWNVSLIEAAGDETPQRGVSTAIEPQGHLAPPSWWPRHAFYDVGS